MGATTAIAWTDHTFNPWWGCTNVSPGCDHCYAETFAKRTGHDVWGKDGERRLFGDKHWNEPLRWERQAQEERRRHRVFCASMADVFEAHPQVIEHRTRVWWVIENTPHLDWQLLTKRPENVLRFVPFHWSDEGFPPNVWMGTTVEDEARARIRVPRLMRIPAKVRFLSCEPLLGEIDLSVPLHDGIDWVIVGGESGPHHRPLNLDHARNIRTDCAMAGVPFFFKQVGGRTPTAGGDELDGRTHKAFPLSGVA